MPIRTIQASGGKVHRFKVDVEERTVLSTSQRGGLIVACVTDAQVLWSLGSVRGWCGIPNSADRTCTSSTTSVLGRIWSLITALPSSIALAISLRFGDGRWTHSDQKLTCHATLMKHKYVTPLIRSLRSHLNIPQYMTPLRSIPKCQPGDTICLSLSWTMLSPRGHIGLYIRTCWLLRKMVASCSFGMFRPQALAKQSTWWSHLKSRRIQTKSLRTQGTQSTTSISAKSTYSFAGRAAFRSTVAPYFKVDQPGSSCLSLCQACERIRQRILSSRKRVLIIAYPAISIFEATLVSPRRYFARSKSTFQRAANKTKYSIAKK